MSLFPLASSENPQKMIATALNPPIKIFRKGDHLDNKNYSYLNYLTQNDTLDLLSQRARKKSSGSSIKIVGIDIFLESPDSAENSHGTESLISSTQTPVTDSVSSSKRTLKRDTVSTSQSQKSVSSGHLCHTQHQILTEQASISSHVLYINQEDMRCLKGIEFFPAPPTNSMGDLRKIQVISGLAQKLTLEQEILKKQSNSLGLLKVQIRKKSLTNCHSIASGAGSKYDLSKGICKMFGDLIATVRLALSIFRPYQIMYTHFFFLFPQKNI